MQEEFEGPTDAQPITSSIGTSLFEGPQRTEEDKDEESSVEETPLLWSRDPTGGIRQGSGGCSEILGYEPEKPEPVGTVFKSVTEHSSRGTNF